MVKVNYSSVDNCRSVRQFKTIVGARRYAHKMVGAHPEIGSCYAVSGDGIGKVQIAGATLAEIFPTDDVRGRGSWIYGEDYGDGRPTFHYGQDGDPRNGERVFNTKEDDARSEAEAASWRNQMNQEDGPW